jgi:hypothetical protein
MLHSKLAGVRYLADPRDFHLVHIVETGSQYHPDSYSMGTDGCLTGTKRQGIESHHSPTSGTKEAIPLLLVSHKSSGRNA